MKISSLTCVAAAAAFASAFADTYDQRLEFIATTGTQWIDTGIHFNYKRSVFRAVFRVVERPETMTSVCGATDVADSRTGYSAGKYFATDLNLTKRSNGNYVVIPSFTGGENDGYLWPSSGSYTTDKSIEVESDVATSYTNGKKGGGYYTYGKLDQAMSASFYIGAVNNAGTGLLNPEGSLAKLHWYGLKIWTDGVLVGDFIPVKKNGVAGFFDTVTETFFPSQGADAFVAPVEVAWTGGGAAGDFSDGGNWDGGVAPSGRGQVAVFPAATTVPAADSDCAGFFNSLGGIRLSGQDTTLHFTNILNATDFLAPVGGEGTLCVQCQQNVAKSFNIYSASPNFCGTFMLTNAYISIYAGYALGAKELGNAVYQASYGDMRLQFLDYVPCHSKIHLRPNGQLLFANVGSSMDAWLIFDGNAGVTFHGNGNQTFVFKGKMTGLGETQYGINLNAGNYTFSGEAKDFGLRKVVCSGGTTYRFGAPMSFATQPTDSSSTKQANIVQGCGAGTTWRFEADNVFSTNTFAYLSSDKPVADRPIGTVDLDGHDQRLGTLGIYATTFDPDTTWNTNLVITSAEPATLTIYGYMRDYGAAFVYPGRLSGAASLTLNSLEEIMTTAYNWSDPAEPGSIKFNNPMNDTTGTLTAERGTIEIMPSATFSNLTALVASGTGAIRVGTSEVGVANPDFRLAVKDAGATIELADGVELTADAFEIPGGRFLMPGVYSATGAGDTTVEPSLSGDGTVEVLHYGGTWEGWPDVGTSEYVYVPAGAVVAVTDDDVEKVEALSSIELGGGAEVNCRLESKTLNLGASLVGSGRFRYWGAGETVVIRGDNSGLLDPGGFFFSNVTVVVSNMYGLGGADTAAAEFYHAIPRDTYANVLRFGGESVTTNFAPIVFAAGATIYNDNPGSAFVLAGDVTQTYRSTYPNIYRLHLRGNFTLASGATMLIGSTYQYSGNRLTIEDGATMNTGGQYGAGNIDIYGSVTGSLAIEQVMKRITFYRANTLSLTDCFMYDSSAKTFVMDLNGFDQAVPRIKGVAYYNGNQQVFEVTSAKPAVLTVNGDNASYKREAAIKMTGAASLALASPLTNTTGFATSTTTGDLRVVSGAFKMERNAKWTGGRVLLEGGALVVDPSAITNTFGDGKSDVEVEVTGGRLALLSDQATPTVRTISVNGEYLPRGTYSASNAGWIEGPGSIYCRKSGKNMGLLLIYK